MLMLYVRASLAHVIDAAGGLERAEQDESRALRSLHKDVEEPVHAVIEVDVGSACRVGFHELSGAGAEPGMAGRVVDRVVCLRFHDHAGAGVPLEVASDEGARAGDWVAGEEILVDGVHGGGEGGIGCGV